MSKAVGFTWTLFLCIISADWVMANLPGGGPGGSDLGGRSSSCYQKNLAWADNLSDLKTGISSYEKCRDICETTTNCLAWTWTTPDHSLKEDCFLYHQTTHQMSNGAVVSGVVSQDYMCVNDRLGIHQSITKEENCQNLCRIAEGCNHYTWFDSNAVFLKNLCFLYSDCPNKSDCPDIGCHSRPIECSPRTVDLIYSGGNNAHAGAAIMNVNTKEYCRLQNHDIRYGHTLNGLKLCGGCGHVYCQKQCKTFNNGDWFLTHNLIYQRYFHVSWDSPQGVLLIGGIYEHTGNTTELLNDQGGSVEKFKLKNPAKYSCLINEGDTFLLLGGVDTNGMSKNVNRYSSEGWFEDLNSLITARYQHACAQYTNNIGEKVTLVCGGFGDLSSCESNIGSMPGTPWTEIGSLPVGLRSPRGLSINNRVLILGGVSGSGIAGLSKNIYELDKDTNAWTVMGEMDYGREWHAVSALSGHSDLWQHCQNS